MSPPAPIVLSPFSSSDAPTSHSTISLLPFHVSYSGPSKIASYFPTRPHSSSTSKALEASFRGRLVVAQDLPVPADYKGIVLKSLKPAPREPVTGGANFIEGDERALKKAKVVVVKTTTTTASTSIGLARMGTRRSPRKKIVAQKFSMDSDEEDEEEGGEKSDREMGMDASLAETEVVEDLKAEETEEIAPNDASSVVETESLKSTITSIATLSATTSFITSTPTTPLSTTSSFPQLLTTDTELESQEEALARDVQHLVPSTTFDALRIWNADYELDAKEDVYGKAVGEWIGVAAMIHAY